MPSRCRSRNVVSGVCTPASCSIAGTIVVSRNTDSNSLVVSKLRFSSAIGIDAVGLEPRPDVVVAVALLLEESADGVLREHRVGRRPIVAYSADLLGQVVEVLHIQDRREREVGRAVGAAAVGGDLETARRQPVIDVVAGDPEAAFDRVRRAVTVEDEVIDVARAGCA